MFLYFIEAGNAIKVGVATNVENRMNTIQTDNAEKIKLLHSVFLPDGMGHKVEKSIHDLFYRTSLRGEWFQSTQFMKEYIENIKDNGFDTHETWIENHYKNSYSEVLEILHQLLETDTVQGNLISVDKLIRDINYLVDPFSKIYDGSKSLVDAVKETLHKIALGQRFHIDTIYKSLKVVKRTHKQAVSRVLSRLAKEKNMICRFNPSGTYIKITAI